MTTIKGVRKVAGGKYQITVAEVIKKEGISDNVVALLNEGDERFAQADPKARLAFMSASAEGLLKLGIDVKKLKVTEKGTELNIENPMLNGKALRVQINETQVPTEWQAANAEKAAKSNGKGLYFLKDGNFIFSNTTLTNAEPKHTIIFSEIRGTFAQGSCLAPAVKLVTVSDDSAQ